MWSPAAPQRVRLLTEEQRLARNKRSRDKYRQRKQDPVAWAHYREQIQRWNRKARAKLPKLTVIAKEAYLANPNLCWMCNCPILPKPGESGLWRVKILKFCSPSCSSDYQKASARLRNSNRALERGKRRNDNKRKRYFEKILRIYGAELAAEWERTPDYRTEHSRVRMLRLKNSLLQRKHGIKATPNLIGRIESLNRACGLPLLNIGWHCMCCGASHKDPRFFDVDHILPTCHGGQDEHTNKQCLCPNCHRKKTLEIEGFKKHQSFKTGQSSIQLLLQGHS